MLYKFDLKFWLMKGFSGNVVGLCLFIGWLLAIGCWLLAKAKCQKL